MRFCIHTIHQIFDISQLPNRLQDVTKMGIHISFVLLLWFTLLMAMYVDYQSSYLLFEISSLGIQSTSMLLVGFLICGASFNRILKEKNG